MGADLIVVSIPGFIPTPERRAVVIALIQASEIHEEVCDICCPWLSKDEDDDFVRNAWTNQVLEAFDVLEDSRQISRVFTHTDNSSWVYVTGGMSWGDTPSDYHDAFCLMHYGGILEEMKKWATEDRMIDLAGKVK